MFAHEQMTLTLTFSKYDTETFTVSPGTPISFMLVVIQTYYFKTLPWLYRQNIHFLNLICTKINNYAYL